MFTKDVSLCIMPIVKKYCEREDMKIQISPLVSGSSGNATYIGTDSTGLLVDAGTTGKNLLALLSSISVQKPAGILVTHEHNDHISAVGILSRKLDIPIYANTETWAAMEKKIGNIHLRNIREITAEEFYIGDICIRPFETSHDAAHPFGYTFYANGAKLCTMTDTGRLTKEMLMQAEGSDLILLEANHDIDMLKNGPYPKALQDRILGTKGHLSNVQAANAAVELVKSGVRGILLGHLSKENNTLELAFKTVKNTLTENGIIVGRDVGLGMTKRDSFVGPYTL